VGITVAASELADVTYVGASDVGAETVWARADDGGGAWGPWKDWTMDTVYRLEEWVGTAGNDVIATPNLDTIYFGLAGNDIFNIQVDNEPFVVGGAGNDTYSMVSGIGLVTIAEYGNSPMDQLNASIPFASLGAATIDGRRHLLLQDINTGNTVIQLAAASQPDRNVHVSGFRSSVIFPNGAGHLPIECADLHMGTAGLHYLLRQRGDRLLRAAGDRDYCG
jgi:Ca2+-binding RTX toxin-like protein